MFSHVCILKKILLKVNIFGNYIESCRRDLQLCVSFFLDRRHEIMDMEVDTPLQFHLLKKTTISKKSMQENMIILIRQNGKTRNIQI